MIFLGPSIIHIFLPPGSSSLFVHDPPNFLSFLIPFSTSYHRLGLLGSLSITMYLSTNISVAFKFCIRFFLTMIHRRRHGSDSLINCCAWLAQLKGVRLDVHVTLSFTLVRPAFTSTPLFCYRRLQLNTLQISPSFSPLFAELSRLPHRRQYGRPSNAYSSHSRDGRRWRHFPSPWGTGSLLRCKYLITYSLLPTFQTIGG